MVSLFDYPSPTHHINTVAEDRRLEPVGDEYDRTPPAKPLERVDVREGLPLPDEVKQVVANRSGSILSASTILKSDFFSNLQKMSLPE